MEEAEGEVPNAIEAGLAIADDDEEEDVDVLDTSDASGSVDHR